MEKQISRVKRTTARKKRRMVFLIVVMTSLVLGLILQGCGSQPVDETILTPTPVPWCDAEEDFYEEVDYLGELSADGIQMEICIPGGKGNFSFASDIPDLEEYPPPLEVEEPFPILALITYLKILDIDHNPVSDFKPSGLKMRIIYTEDAWAKALENDGAEKQGHPRVAYLVWEGDGWGEEWIEFEVTDYSPPGTERNPEGTGFLIITIDELPDPLIGDC